MTPDDEAARSVAAELATSGSGGQHRDRWYAVRRFEAWCATRDLPSEPMTEQNLLRFLHDHHPDWSHGYAKNIVSRLAAEARARGDATPRGPRVTAYLLRLRRELGSRPQPLMEACRVQEARLMAANPVAVPSLIAAQEILTVRAAVIVAAATGLPLAGTGRRQARASEAPAYAVDLTARQFAVRDGRIVIGADPKSPLAVISATSDRLAYDLVAAALSGWPAEQFPLLGPQQRSHRWTARSRPSLRSSWPSRGQMAK